MRITDEMIKRAEQEAWYMIENKATVRQVSAILGVSKSTVYSDLTEVLPTFNNVLYNETQEILQKNKEERAVRGGKANGLRFSKQSK